MAQAIVDMLDVKLFLRVPQDLLQRRREERQTYVLQSKSSPIPHHTVRIISHQCLAQG